MSVEVSFGSFGDVEHHKDYVVKIGDISRDEIRSLRRINKLCPTLSPKYIKSRISREISEVYYKKFHPGKVWMEKLEGFRDLSYLCASEKEALTPKIVQAIKAMHLSGVAHGDLHDRNIMVSQNKGEVKIIDYGMSHINYRAALLEALYIFLGDRFIYETELNARCPSFDLKARKMRKNREVLMSVLKHVELDLSYKFEGIQVEYKPLVKLLYHGV